MSCGNGRQTHKLSHKRDSTGKEYSCFFPIDNLDCMLAIVVNQGGVGGGEEVDCMIVVPVFTALLEAQNKSKFCRWLGKCHTSREKLAGKINC